MDAGYPSAANFAASATRGITLIAPVIAKTGRNAKKDTFTPLDFTIDWAGGQARCPAGALSRSMRPNARGLVTFRFRVRDCRPCPLREKCTKAVNLDLGRSITIHPEPVHQARLNAHRAQQGEDWAKDPDDALTACRHAIELLLVRTGPTLPRADRERGLMGAAWLPSTVAAAALAAGQPELAVELLEQTRATLMAETLHRRMDLSDVQALDPRLAEDFALVGAELRACDKIK